MSELAARYRDRFPILRDTTYLINHSLGAMPAAVVGCAGTVAVALLWMNLFPALRNVERLE